MLKNRSVPANILLPHIAYNDLPAAIEWLHNTFGFVEHYRYGNPISGAQVHLGDAWMMLNAARNRYRSPAELGFGTQSLTVFVEEVEAHFARAKAADARIVEDLHETEYGELQYGVEDPEGHHWLFSRHARDVSPDAWGATIANAIELPPRPSNLNLESLGCYLLGAAGLSAGGAAGGASGAGAAAGVAAR